MLKYTNGTEVLIGIMKPNSTYRYIVDTDTHQENALAFIYRDYSGVKYKKVVMGYILKGERGRESLTVCTDLKKQEYRGYFN